MNMHIPHDSVSTVYVADTLVVGGGTAGVFAAIAAAKSGAKTVLIEKNGILGGTMTTGGINYPGLFYAWGKQIIAGPCWESILKTVALGGATLPKFQKHPKNHWDEQIRLNIPLYAYILDCMAHEAGVTVLLHTMLADVTEKATGIESIAVGKDGLFGIKTKTIIDATGDLNAVHMLGYAYETSQTQQPATLTNRLTGYCYDDLDTETLMQELASAAKETGYEELVPWRLNQFLKAYSLHSIHIPCVGCADSASKSTIERAAREKIQKILAYLRKIDKLSAIKAEEICIECGIRETRRLIGEETVTVEDYVQARCFDDAICYAFYPVDLHVQDGIEQVFLEEDKVPTIPYGALVPKGAKRVLVCGRSISSDALANSALRVQAPCMATGQAAGCAAAIMAEENKSAMEVEYHALCNSLKKLGAIVPTSEER